MIKIDYELYPDWLEEDRQEIKDYDYTSLEASFEGKQTFIVNEVNFESVVGLIAFAGALLDAVRIFDAGGTEAYFWHIDSGWTIHFERVDDMVKIWDTIKRGPVTVPYTELKDATLRYVARFKEEFYDLIPELRENELFVWGLDEKRPAEVNE